MTENDPTALKPSRAQFDLKRRREHLNGYTCILGGVLAQMAMGPG